MPPPPSSGLEKIVIPKEVAVCGLFWGQNTPPTIKFLSANPRDISFFTQWGRGRLTTFIVPDGSRDCFLNKMREDHRPYLAEVIELSDYLQQIN